MSGCHHTPLWLLRGHMASKPMEEETIPVCTALIYSVDVNSNPFRMWDSYNDGSSFLLVNCRLYGGSSLGMIDFSIGIKKTPRIASTTFPPHPGSPLQPFPQHFHTPSPHLYTPTLAHPSSPSSNLPCPILPSPSRVLGAVTKYQRHSDRSVSYRTAVVG